MQTDDSSSPLFNFPYQNGRTGKKRELFIDYGTTSFIDVDKDGEILSQRSKGDNIDRYFAVHPVLPLSCTAEEVKVPLKDRIMGPIMDENKKLNNFVKKVKSFYSQCKRWGKDVEIEEILSGVEICKAELKDTTVTVADYDVGVFEQTTGMQIRDWFRDFLKDFTEIVEFALPKLNNYMYMGGCIDTVDVDDRHCYTVSAAGENFNNLRLTFVSKKAEGLLQSFSAEEINLPHTIYGVRSRRVHGQDYVTVRTDEQCYMYKFTQDSEDGKLHMVTEPLNKRCESVDISPYIEGECVLVDEDGQCSLWSGDSIITIAANGEPRFEVSDKWRYVQYGSHPRQVVYADQTAVQLFDMRTSDAEGQDLFSLPSKLLHNKERIRACGRHQASTFYHLVATDYNLLIMDERFVKCPVLKWEHMLSTPPQYMDDICGSVVNCDDNFIYLASQYPADVHAFRFSAKQGVPPLAVSKPHRAAKIVDISKWPQFVDRCPNTDLLFNRLNTSLAGICTIPWQQGHVVFQLDSHGELFHQVFSTSQSPADITFSAGQGSHDLKPLPAAVERAQTWVESWREMMKKQLSNKSATREVQPALLGIYTYRNPHPSCCICHPDLSNIPGGIEINSQNETCHTCLMELQDGQNLINSVQKDGVLASTSECRPRNLKQVDEVPKDSALSKLLMKHWYGDEDGNTLEDILKIWDKEVLEKRRMKKRGKDKVFPDMTEQSVINRLQNKSSRPTGSSPEHADTSSSNENGEESIASDTDDLDGQKVKKQQCMSKKLQNLETLSQKLPENVETSARLVTEDIHRKKRRKRNESSVDLDRVSTESVILGSVDTYVSETFPLVANERTSTGFSMLTSSIARQQKTHNLPQSNQHTTPSKARRKSQIKSKSESVSLCSSHGSEISKTSTIFKIPDSTSKGKSKIKRKKSDSQSVSDLPEETLSERSVNVGSEDLFDDSSLGEPEKDSEKISSVFSIPSCEGLLDSHVKGKQVISRQLFSSQQSDRNTINRTLSSPRKSHVDSSPKKSTGNKYFAGF